MRRIVAALLVALTLAGCSILAGCRDAPAPTGPRISWSPCAPPRTERNHAVRLECATIKVPQNWAAPDPGRTFSIGLTRARSPKQRERIGSLVVYPDTPGASAAQLVDRLAGVLPDDLLARFDLVGLDPRGLAGSGYLDCLHPVDLETYFGFDPDPAAQARFDTLVAVADRLGSACSSVHGEKVQYHSTRQTAHDLDAVRTAVGDAKLTFLGYGYGTLLGAVYAHLFPRNVRAQVLIGALDPRSRRSHQELRAQGLERAFESFATWCRGNPGAGPPACPIAPDARAALTAALQAAATSRVPWINFTFGWVHTAVTAAMYDRTSWPGLADAIARLNRGNAEPIVALASSFVGRGERGSSYSAELDAGFAVTCNDNPEKVEDIRKRQDEWRTKYPLFGPRVAVHGLVCAYWRGNGDPYLFGEAHGAPPILVVGTRSDPATPYEQAAELARTLGVGVVLGTDGSSRTVYPQSGCVSAAVTTYLLDVRPPTNGLDCRAR